MLLLCFSCFNSLFASHFFKNVLPAYTGNMILQNDFKQFQSKFSLFWPPNGLHKSYFCHFCSLLSSLGSFGSLFFRSVPPSKFWLWPMTCAFLASRALSAKNECMHRCNNFVNFVYDLQFSLCHSWFKHLFLQNIHHFSKKCFPPSVGSMILKAAQKQNHETYASWALQFGAVCTCSGTIYCSSIFTISIEKTYIFVYGLLLLLASYIYHRLLYRMN